MKLWTAISIAALATTLVGAGCVDDTTCSVSDNGDGTHTMACPDGTSAVLVSPEGLPAADNDPVGNPITDPDLTNPGDPTDPGDGASTDGPPPMIMPGQLSDGDLARIDDLRDAIGLGLTVGQVSYIEQVSLTLQGAGIVDDYESGLDGEWSASNGQVEECPFLKYQGNVIPSPAACEHLVDLAKIETYSEIAQLLADNPLPDAIGSSENGEEADFWYEQGAVSGIEQHRVLVRADLKAKQLCNQVPTPKEGSYEKGLLVGGQLMADAFNEWLAANGHKADYPAMSSPIDVCNINESILDPAFDAADGASDTITLDQPLCADYEPPTPTLAMDYGQSELEYGQGVKDGVADEFALATVKMFRVVPCNVSDPLVVDLDGDGLELLPIERGVNFDVYGTGRLQAVAWVHGDDGLLALDRNDNGAIDDGTELFGNIDQRFDDGFAQLATLDANGDGAVTAADPAFAKLVVWQDVDSDGATDDGELLQLAAVGITAIPVVAVELSLRAAGTRIPLVAEATTADGGTAMVGDAFFTTAPHASPRLAR